jgi:hypothetical protein
MIALVNYFLTIGGTAWTLYGPTESKTLSKLMFPLPHVQFIQPFYSISTKIRFGKSQ